MIKAMNKKELKDYLYRVFMNRLYYENGTEEIDPGTTIKIEWSTTIYVTQKGAKSINRELKTIDEILNN